VATAAQFQGGGQAKDAGAYNANTHNALLIKIVSMDSIVFHY
jgi:hypothetical protein